MLEHFSVPKRLFSLWRVLRPSKVALIEHLVRYLLLSFSFKWINPWIADTIRKLFLLSPKYVIG
jgi:hypothetical protein